MGMAGHNGNGNGKRKMDVVENRNERNNIYLEMEEIQKQ